MYQSTSAALAIVLANIENKIEITIETAAAYLLEQHQYSTQKIVLEKPVPVGCYETLAGGYHSIEAIEVAIGWVGIKLQLSEDYETLSTFKAIAPKAKIAILEAIETEIINDQNKSL